MEKDLASRGPTALGRTIFFNPGDEEISIPENQSIQKFNISKREYFQIIFWKIWVYFQAFKNSYPQERNGKNEKNLKLKVIWNCKFRLSRKKKAPISKLDLDFSHTLVLKLIGQIHIHGGANFMLIDLDKPDTTLVQISRLFYFFLFSNTNHYQMMI